MFKIQKTKIIFFVIIFFGFFGLVKSSQAVDLCVTPTGLGTKTGADWNNSADWSTLTFVRGNTYYLASGTYGGRIIDTAVSGMNRINIVKATEDAHVTNNPPNDGWVPGMADQAVFLVPGNNFSLNRSYITFDGIIGSGSGDGVNGFGLDESNYGFKLVPSNCSNTALGHGLMQAPFSATTNIDNIVIRHTAFVECLVADQIDGQGYVGLKSTMYNATYTKTNFIVEYNLFKNGSTNLHSTGSDAGSSVRYNYFGAQTCPTSCQQISNGNTEINTEYHHNIFMGGAWAIMGVHGQYSRNVKVYNNIIYCDLDNLNLEPAIARASSSPRGTLDEIMNWEVYNNTTVNCQGGSVGDGWFKPGNLSDLSYKSLAYNNLFYNVKTCNFPNLDGVPEAIERNSNYYSGCTEVTPTGDTNAQITTSDPFNNSAGYDYTLAAHTSVGVNLSSVFTTDFIGTGRSYWDRGAYEYVSSDTTPPAAPSGLAVN